MKSGRVAVMEKLRYNANRIRLEALTEMSKRWIK